MKTHRAWPCAHAYPDDFEHDLRELFRVLTYMLLELLKEVNSDSVSLQKIHQCLYSFCSEVLALLFCSQDLLSALNFAVSLKLLKLD